MRLLLLAALLCSGIALAEPATLLKDSELRASPLGDARVIALLKARDKVTLNTRKGAWAAVKTAGGETGWVRLFNLRTGSGQRGASGLGNVASLFRTGSSGNTVSTGVKGLSEEQLKNAKPNPDEAARLNTFMESDADARNFARQAKLATHHVDYLTTGETP
jgi:hypothetical protein